MLTDPDENLDGGICTRLQGRKRAPPVNSTVRCGASRGTSPYDDNKYDAHTFQDHLIQEELEREEARGEAEERREGQGGQKGEAEGRKEEEREEKKEGEGRQAREEAREEVEVWVVRGVRVPAQSPPHRCGLPAKRLLCSAPRTPKFQATYFRSVLARKTPWQANTFAHNAQSALTNGHERRASCSSARSPSLAHESMRAAATHLRCASPSREL